MKEIYYHLLVLQDPLTVREVEFDVDTQQVDIWVENGSQAYICPECKSLCPFYNYVPERSWRHLYSCGYKTFKSVSVN